MLESLDVAFRLGYEQGAMAAQQQQMQDQQQQVAEQQAAEAQGAANGGMPGQEGQEGAPGQDDGARIQDDSRGVGQQAQGADGMGSSELDSHINELEGVMAKTEYGSDAWEALNKSIFNLKSIKIDVDLKKNEKLIKSVSQNLKKKQLNLNPRASHNLAEKSKKALSMQHSIVNGLMDTWEKEEKGLPTDIAAILRSESLTKKV